MRKNAVLLLVGGCTMMLINSVSAAGFKQNPELNKLPVFENEALMAMQKTLVSQQQELAAGNYQYASPDAPVACDIASEILWKLATSFDSQAEAERAVEQHMPPNIKSSYENHVLSGTLLDGQCQNGKLNGPVRLALTRSVTVTSTLNGNPLTSSLYTENQRVQARFVDNKLEGQLTRSSVEKHTPTANSPVKVPTTTLHRGDIWTYKQNKPVGDQLNMVWHVTPTQSLVSTVTRYHPDGSSTVQSHYGTYPFQEHFYDANGMLHGLKTLRSLVMFEGVPASPEQKQCYQHGQLQATLAACGVSNTAAVAPATVASASALTPPEARFIDGSSGAFLSPITSDGVAAEWVEKSISVGLGSSLGSAAGAYAGQKLLGSVPFVGGFLGQKAGAAVGRTTALQTVGGEAFMRSTTDISFHSLSDMAAWLKQNHATHPRMGEILKAAGKIYPDLPLAYAQAR